MNYIVLARKYRPQSFSEVYAQDHVTEILQNSIEANRIAHAFLFTGPRGVGKTSMARIMAKSLNCIHGPTAHPCNECANCVDITAGVSSDVIEIDGASNTSVDDVRDLQKELVYAPTQSKYKIYIIDEVHMLSKSAFNALLKTLEEPPDNVVFIFATTEAQKVLPTIVSRCQRHDFKRIPVEAIVRRLREICKLEGIKVDEESLHLIARKADGGMRDALSLMDQVLSYCLNDVSVSKVREIFGVIPTMVFSEMFKLIKARDSATLINQLHEVLDAGMDAGELLVNMTEFIRVALLRKVGVAPSDITSEEYAIYDEVANLFAQDDLLYLISTLIQARNEIRTSSNPQLLLEVLMLRLCKIEEMTEVSELIKLVTSGAHAASPAPTRVASPAPSKTTSPTPGTSKPAPAPKSQPTQAPTTTAKPAPPAPAPPPASIPEPEPEPAPPANIKFDKEAIELHKDKLKAQLQKKLRFGPAHAFAEAEIVKCEADRLCLLSKSPTLYDALISHREEIEQILGEFFAQNVRLTVELSRDGAAPKIEIKERSIQDIKNEDPLLAKYIDITKSKLGPGS